MTWITLVLLASGCSSPPELATTSQTTLANRAPPPSTVSASPTSTTGAGGSIAQSTTTQSTVPPPAETAPTDPDNNPPPGSSTTQAPTTSTQPDPPSPEPPPPPAPPRNLRFTEVAQGARNPIFLTAHAGASYSYLAEQVGLVWQLTDGQLSDRPVLDISREVTFRGEQGLLGMALHPTQNQRLFLHYSDRQGHTVVSEFALSDDGATADPGSERIIFFVQQPAGNHNGGMIQFGPDGYLYLGLGDGGRAGDYYGHGQRPDTVLAAMVRIDPDQTTAQVWWYGLRNPWRLWIDASSNLVYIADVGQNAYEEISVANLSDPGLNFGWPITEGFHCYEPRRGCDVEGLTLPALEVAHGDGGTCSVTGGIVYRGPSMPGLDGHYFYSDYCGGYLRSFRWDGTLATDLREWASDLGRVVSFGTDGSGEMYVLTTDTVYLVEPIE